jgi:hypothetical protein
MRRMGTRHETRIQRAGFKFQLRPVLVAVQFSNCTTTPVILSGAGSSRSEPAAESKDPYELHECCALRGESNINVLDRWRLALL